jgi:hypothetical protein
MRGRRRRIWRGHRKGSCGEFPAQDGREQVRDRALRRSQLLRLRGTAEPGQDQRVERAREGILGGEAAGLEQLRQGVVRGGAVLERAVGEVAGRSQDLRGVVGVEVARVAGQDADPQDPLEEDLVVEQVPVAVLDQSAEARVGQHGPIEGVLERMLDEWPGVEDELLPFPVDDPAVRRVPEDHLSQARRHLHVAAPRDPGELGCGLGRVGHVLQDLGAIHEVELAIVEGQGLDRRLHVAHALPQDRGGPVPLG